MKGSCNLSTSVRVNVLPFLSKFRSGPQALALQLICHFAILFLFQHSLCTAFVVLNIYFRHSFALYYGVLVSGRPNSIVQQTSANSNESQSNSNARYFADLHVSVVCLHFVCVVTKDPCIYLELLNLSFRVSRRCYPWDMITPCAHFEMASHMHCSVF
jgi:hypothetical protein